MTIFSSPPRLVTEPNHRIKRGSAPAVPSAALPFVVVASLLCLTGALGGCDDGPGVGTDTTGVGSAGAAGSASSGAAGTSTAPQEIKKPDFTIVKSATGCPGLTTADVLLSPAPTNAFVVAWMIVDECTGAGGQYLIARDLDGDREFFLGAHACYELPPADFPTYPPPPVRFGVLHADQTAALFTAGPCVAFPEGESEIRTDFSSRALEVYGSEADARAALAAR